MEDIFYRENHKPCKSENGRYILSSRGSLTKEVKLSISKVKVSKNDGVLLCHLMNSREQPKNFNLTVNVKGLLNFFVANFMFKVFDKLWNEVQTRATIFTLDRIEPARFTNTNQFKLGFYKHMRVTNYVLVSKPCKVANHNILNPLCFHCSRG